LNLAEVLQTIGRVLGLNKKPLTIPQTTASSSADGPQSGHRGPLCAALRMPHRIFTFSAADSKIPANGPDRAETKWAGSGRFEATVVRTWLAMWEQRDPFCDDAVRHLQTLIPENKCYVVVTLGIGCEPRSLVFRRWKHVLPLARNIAEQKAELLEYDFYKMLVSPEAPIARNDRQFWHQTCTGTRAQKVFQSNGADWMLYGYVR